MGLHLHPLLGPRLSEVSQLFHQSFTERGAFLLWHAALIHLVFQVDVDLAEVGGVDAAEGLGLGPVDPALEALVGEILVRVLLELLEAHDLVQDVHRRSDELPLPQKMEQPLDESPELDDEPLVQLPFDPEEPLPLEPLVHEERPLQGAEAVVRDHEDRRILPEQIQDPTHDTVQLLPVGLHDISFMPELMLQPVAAGEDKHVELARDVIDEVLGCQAPLLQDLVDVLY